jgi:hypothetical protein
MTYRQRDFAPRSFRCPGQRDVLYIYSAGCQRMGISPLHLLSDRWKVDTEAVLLGPRTGGGVCACVGGNWQPKSCFVSQLAQSESIDLTEIEVLISDVACSCMLLAEVTIPPKSCPGNDQFEQFLITVLLYSLSELVFKCTI